MISFNQEAYKRLVSEMAGSPDAAEEIKAVILAYIAMNNELVINEMSEYPDQLSTL